MLPRLFRRRAVGLLALALAAPSVVRAQSFAPYVDSEWFDDWALVCDNGRRCTAVGLPPQAVRIAESGNDALLMIVRDPEAGAQARMEIVIPYWEGPGSGASWTLVDGSGKPIASTLSVRFAPASHVLRFRLPPTSIATLLGARDEITLAADGKPTIALSLIGMKAALARLDAVQGRSGGVTATISKGVRPASAVPTPPPLPVVRQAPRSQTTSPRLKTPPALVALSGQLSALEICSDMANGVPSETVGKPYRLDDRTLLWTIWCAPGSNKGFNQTDIPVASALDGRDLRLLAFEGDPAPAKLREIMRAHAQDEANLSIPTLSGFGFDASTGVVEQSDISATIAESRGSFGRYVWTGRQMALIEASDVSVPAVGGSANAAPYFKIWPPYYRAIVKSTKTTRRTLRPAAPPR